MPLNDTPGRITRWTDYECAGGEPFALIGVYDECEINEAIDDAGRYRVRVPPLLGADIQTDEVHRVVDLTGVVREFRIVGRRVIAGAEDVTEFTGESPLMELADIGVITDTTGPVPVFDFGAELSVLGWLEYVCAHMTAQGQTWWEPGEVSSVEFVYIVASATGSTPLEILRFLQDDQGLELGVRRVGGAAFALDLVAELGSAAPRPVIRWGRNLRTHSRQSDIGQRATAIIVQGRVPDGAERAATIAENVWNVTSIIGTTPAWVTLADVQGREGPIAFDGQLADRGVHVMLDGGTCIAVLDSRISDNAIQVPDGSAFAVDARVQFVADSAGKRLIELTAPRVRRMARTIQVETVRGERNLIVNPMFTSWTDGVTPRGGWTKIGACQVARFKRPELYGNWSAAADGAHSIGATSIALRGAIPDSRIYGSERLHNATSGSIYPGGGVHQADGSGNIVLPLRLALGVNIPDGRVFDLYNITQSLGTTLVPIRPYWETLPEEPRVPPVDGYALRFTTPASTDAWPPTVGQDQIRSPGVAVKVFGGVQQLNASAGFTLTHSSSSGTYGNRTTGNVVTTDPATIGATGRRLPVLLLVDVTATPTLLAYGVVAGAIPAGKSTMHETVEVSATITSDSLVALGVAPGRVYDVFQMMRWVNLWIGLSANVPPYDGAWGTLLWQRTNRELLARSSDANNVEITFADLSLAAGYEISVERLTLGGRLDLGDGGTYPRVLALRLDLVDPENSRVVLDGRSTRMTKLLAERL